MTTGAQYGTLRRKTKIEVLHYKQLNMSYSNISANNQCFEVLYLQRFIRLLAEFLPEKKHRTSFLINVLGVSA